MRKIIVFVLILILIWGLCACGSKEVKTETSAYENVELYITQINEVSQKITIEQYNQVSENMIDTAVVSICGIPYKVESNIDVFSLFNQFINEEKGKIEKNNEYTDRKRLELKEDLDRFNKIIQEENRMPDYENIEDDALYFHISNIIMSVYEETQDCFYVWTYQGENGGEAKITLSRNREELPDSLVVSAKEQKGLK